MSSIAGRGLNDPAGAHGVADDAALSASEKENIALRLKVLNAIVLRLTAILGVQFNGLLNVQSEPANRVYIGLRKLAELRAVPFPLLSAALTTFTASYPNLYQCRGKVDWESVTQRIGPFQARVSEELLRVSADLVTPLPVEWAEFFAAADAAIGELQQERQDRDADFEARVAALTEESTIAGAFPSAKDRLRIDERESPTEMRTPTSWAAISGRWRLPLEDGSGDRSLDYLGPGPGQALSYGLAICDLSLAAGAISGEITFDRLDETAAGLVIGFFGANSPYVIAELGAHGSAYAISYYVPLAERWTSRPMIGSKTNLRPLAPYAVSVRLDGLRISMSVDGIAIVDQMLEQPLMGARVGVYAWGERGSVHFDRLVVRDRRVVASSQELPAPARRGGRPKGRSFGFLLDCWFTCHHFVDRFDSQREAYDAVEALAQAGRISYVDVPLRPRYPAARSYAAAVRCASDGKCLWYRHKEPPPSE
jgi:hypothetical protein